MTSHATLNKYITIGVVIMMAGKTNILWFGKKRPSFPIV